MVNSRKNNLQKTAARAGIKVSFYVCSLSKEDHFEEVEVGIVTGFSCCAERS